MTTASQAQNTQHQPNTIFITMLASIGGSMLAMLLCGIVLLIVGLIFRNEIQFLVTQPSATPTATPTSTATASSTTQTISRETVIEAAAQQPTVTAVPPTSTSLPTHTPTATAVLPTSTPLPVYTAQPTKTPFGFIAPTPTAAPLREQLPGFRSVGVQGHRRIEWEAGNLKTRGFGTHCLAYDHWGWYFAKGGRYAEDGTPLIDHIVLLPAGGNAPAYELIKDVPILPNCLWSPDSRFLAVQLVDQVAIVPNPTIFEPGRFNIPWWPVSGGPDKIKLWLQHWTQDGFILLADEDNGYWLADPWGNIEPNQNGMVARLSTGRTLEVGPSMDGQKYSPWDSTTAGSWTAP